MLNFFSGYLLGNRNYKCICCADLGASRGILNSFLLHCPSSHAKLIRSWKCGNASDCFNCLAKDGQTLNIKVWGFSTMAAEEYAKKCFDDAGAGQMVGLQDMLQDWWAETIKSSSCYPPNINRIFQIGNSDEQFRDEVCKAFVESSSNLRKYTTLGVRPRHLPPTAGAAIRRRPVLTPPTPLTRPCCQSFWSLCKKLVGSATGITLFGLCGKALFMAEDQRILTTKELMRSKAGRQGTARESVVRLMCGVWKWMSTGVLLHRVTFNRSDKSNLAFSHRRVKGNRGSINSRFLTFSTR
jgi:hypothetical protein